MQEFKNQKGESASFRLSLMMFFQYMMFAVWWVPLVAYLTNIGIDGVRKSLVLSYMAIGCKVSPMIGMVAHRYFDWQKVLATLNLFIAGFLLLPGITNNPNLLFVFDDRHALLHAHLEFDQFHRDDPFPFRTVFPDTA